MAEAPTRRLLATLRARFDGAALRVALPDRPVPPLAMPTAAQAARWAPLESWCFDGAGTGRSPLLRPAQAPQVAQRFSVAVWPADDPRDLDLVEGFHALVVVEPFSLHGPDRLASRGELLLREHGPRVVER